MEQISMDNLSRLLYRNIDALCENINLTNKKIILFGINTSSYAIKKYLVSKGLQIYAYIDNNRQKVADINEAVDTVLEYHINVLGGEQSLASHEIYGYKPEELLGEFDDSVIVLIASKYYPYMKKQLEQMGYVENKHFFQVVDYSAIDKMTENLACVSEKSEMTFDEIRECQLDIMKSFVSFCEEEGLRYYLGYGTLLGAVRHKGFIPWDDDIDLLMPYSDYKKFINKFPVWKQKRRHYEVWSPYNYGIDNFTFLTKITDMKTRLQFCEYPFLVTMGVNIDVFPLCGMPKKEDERVAFYRKIRNLNLKYVSSFLEHPTKDIQAAREKEEIHEEILGMMEQYDFDESDMVFTLTSRYHEKEIMPAEIYKSSVKLPFEDGEYTAAAEYETYLSSLYGDYRKIPPEDQRNTYHVFRAYWI